MSLSTFKTGLVGSVPQCILGFTDHCFTNGLPGLLYLFSINLDGLESFFIIYELKY